MSRVSVTIQADIPSHGNTGYRVNITEESPGGVNISLALDEARRLSEFLKAAVAQAERWIDPEDEKS